MKDEEFWNEDAIIKDSLFESNMSVREIGEQIGRSQAYVSKRIKALGLDWVKRSNRKLSRGHASLTEIVKRLLPNTTVINEHHIGERLMLDIYVPSYNLALEYHGRQHFFYSNLFHKDKEDFLEGQRRDERKVELCEEQGITLVAFRFTDELTDESVFDRILDAIKNAPATPLEKKQSSFKGNHFYEKMMASKREYNRQRYKQLKEWKKKNGSK